MAKGSDLRNKLGGMGGPLQPFAKKPALDLSGGGAGDEAGVKGKELPDASNVQSHDAAHGHAPKVSKPLGGAGGAGGRPKV
jgi:hypothetical protein